jgi:predicted XRE-type DNA-binding protein
MQKKHTVKSKNNKTRKAPKSTAGSGNVFADIGFKNADEMALKSDMVWYINREIEARGLTQTEAAELLGINQPKVSALKHGQLTDFSVERLMRFLVLLGQRVDIWIHPARDASVTVVKGTLFEAGA